LKDSILGIKQVEAVAEMEQKYESEKKSGLIQKLKLDKLNSDLFELKLKRRQVILISGSVILFLLAVFLGYSYMNSRRNRRTLELKNSIIDHEREVSDNLLLNILPAEVAQELKEKGTSEARLYDPVTVLFTDFVSFTSISENMSPKNLVAEVNRLFTGYDEIMEKHGLEKIKTIGDAYLAVCGLPFAHDDHAVRVVKAAKEIIAFTLENQSKFMVRVGINSGPVVAGIVGIKKYAYDIWGDTVNTASRMEESSEAGRINISGATHELVKDHFPCEYRGKVEAKNKGEVDMYFVG
jgi:class 3 adenylate cyclase